MTLSHNEEVLAQDLDLANERRENALIQMANYQKQLAKTYKQKVKHRQFLVGDLILRKVVGNTKDPADRKLGPNWEEPYKIVKLAGKGAYHLKDSEGKQVSRPWNSNNLKIYYHLNANGSPLIRKTSGLPSKEEGKLAIGASEAPKFCPNILSKRFEGELVKLYASSESEPGQVDQPNANRKCGLHCPPLDGNSVPNGKLTMNMVKDVLFNEEARKREMGTTDSDELRALVSKGSRERGRGQGRGHQRETAVAAVTTVDKDESNVLLAASHVMADLYEWRTTHRAKLLAKEQSDSAWQTRANGGTLRVSKGNKEMLRGRKTRGLYRLEGSVQTEGATVKHGSSGISKQNEQGKQELDKEVWPNMSGAISVGCPVRSLEEEDKADFEEFCVHKGQEMEPWHLRKSDVLCGAPRWGGGAHLGEKVWTLQSGGAYTSLGRGVAH
ncbi:hypothetical protein Acr_00g0045360 [Actinidia rufa]|uniref:Uncharacterized protein n=1 Tax=Actinidia rufa TaxID=165716 RepID=A0A7J0DJ92_9ERIC|nr:hypothetical protein Acr_00g0045360 [Actinidia rufa]